ncbi:phytoene/squalene synthase family protein [Tetragenococcus halophilus]|uniref:phytoene/squalene synthase family protein n=1 Tax=Tetragenococcus halophilus TaxID=51669 RepID=UPI001032411F|nr:phytoene/squalene synthase family protein [Tetragenococcus halophilus]MCO8294029.1 phytoene/squalene synthase family protein [Tetragenococcus halophilus]GMG68860.1 phytoene/squalene synthase family protein [Tetragenococcus halophilus]GMG69945.1 phytoene/squalene synthase family protein [Tetragenococcus halophilus]
MIMKPTDNFKKRKKEFDYCEKIIQRHSKSFYAAFSQLPKKKAQSIYAIYAFCRLADDIVDEKKDAKQLQELFQQLAAFEAGNVPNEPTWLALEVVFKEFPMDIRPFYDMLVGQRMDLNFQQPRTWQELSEYAYYVAGSVGLMLLPVLSDKTEQIIPHAKRLGETMQLTNILRDIGEDLYTGRIYLPQKEMQRYNVTVEDLKKQKVTQNFIELWESIAKYAEKLYQKSLNMIPYIKKDARQPLLSAIIIYAELLPEIRRNQYDVFNKRQAVSTRKKLELIRTIEGNVEN